MQDTPQNPWPRILLVDDEPHVTHILGRRLGKLGAEVHVARNGSEGYERAVELVPDLILSDLQMPRSDGLDMAVRLAETPTTSQVPIVMLSGRGFLLDDARVRTTRIVEVLEKPFSVSTVIQVFTRVLSWDPPVETAA
ncbi:MAG: response regulator [Planctomycetota bacterium]